MSCEPLLQELSIDDVLNQIKLGKFHYKILFLQYFNVLQQISQVALPGIILPSLTNEFSLTRTEISIYGTVEFFGYFLASIFIGKISDKFGRRKSVLIFKSIWLIAMFLSIFSHNIYVFMIFRCFISFSFMIVIFANFSLVSEIWPQKNRGFVLNFVAFFCVLGFVLAALLARFLIDDIKTANWRLIFFFYTVVLGISLFLNYIFLEESPRYDLFLGQKQRAFTTIEKMARDNMNHNNFLQGGKTAQLELWVEKFNDRLNKVLGSDVEGNNDSSFLSEYKKLFKGSYKKITIIMFIVWTVISCNAFGMDFILPTVLLQISENTNQNPLTILLYINLIILPCMIPSFMMVENKMFGRRKTLTFNFFFMGIGGLFTSFGVFPGSVFWLFVFKLSIHCSYILIFLFTSELYPTSLRVNAMGQSSAFSRLGVMLIVWVAVFLLKIGTYVPFFVFGCMGLIACYIINLLPYETMNEDIDRIIEP